MELHNLKLKPDALSDLGLPVTVQAGLVGSLTLKIPWNALGRSPVEVTMDRLFLLAGPRTLDELSADQDRRVDNEDYLDIAYKFSKSNNVQKEESKWVEEMQHMEQSSSKDPHSSSDGGGGMLKAVIDTVVGNLQLSITNVHMRYEDTLTHPGHPFSCALTLDMLKAHTVDEEGRDTFVTNNPLGMLRKAVDLRRMAVYFDTDTDPWSAEWSELSVASWDDWFLPGVTVGSNSVGRKYVLRPVDGHALYVRKGRGVKKKEGEPITEMTVSLEAICVQLTQPQYQNYQLLLSEISQYTARFPHLGYRPTVRPSDNARLWWKYASKAIISKASKRRLSWNQAVRFILMRSKYVKLYVQHLTSGGGYSDIKNMDASLPEHTILMFRRIAHKEVQREKRKKAQELEAAGGGGGGWIAWLTGRGQQTSTAAAASTPADSTSDLSPEEYARLVELVTEQQEGLRQLDLTPYTLMTRISAKVGSASAILCAHDGCRVLKGGLDGINVELDKYPETLSVNLRVTAMGVHSPEGVFLETGSGGGTTDGDLAFSLKFVHNPQDGSADEALDVILTPSYVYYTASTIERVAEFFKASRGEGELDFTSLSATATTQIERARRLAAAYAASALHTKPRLNLRLALDAPKIAIPSTGRNDEPLTLAIDLGRFVVESDANMNHSKDEAALYEALKLTGSDVAAYLLDGPFSWSDDNSAHRIPLLQRCGMTAGLQVARFMDPARPFLRLLPSIPKLHFHFSPARLGRLLSVLESALPSMSGGKREQSAEPIQNWKQHSDIDGCCQVLTWTGIGKTHAIWCKRYGVVYQGRLGLYLNAECKKPIAEYSLWNASTAIQIVHVPPEAVGGSTNVIGLCSESSNLQQLAQDPSAVLLKLESDKDADLWYRRLLSSQQSMLQLVADEPASEWDDASSDTTTFRSAASEQTLSGDVEQRHGMTTVEIQAQLGELAIYGSGRGPGGKWWPPDEGAYDVDTSLPDNTGGGCIDGEVGLIIVRASSGAAQLSLQASGGLKMHTSLGALEIEDLLLSPLTGRCQHLLKSEGDNTSLAEFSLSIAKPDHVGYQGVDTLLEVSLNRLYFFCNRPTVASIIGFLFDCLAAMPSSNDEVQSQDHYLEGDSLGANLLLASGGGNRKVFSLHVALQGLHLIANYEGIECLSLAKGSVDDFSFHLDVHTDSTLHIDASLGNIQVFDCSIPEGHPYRQIAGLRQGSTASLISVQVNSCLSDSNSENDRVPKDLEYYAVNLALSELRIVYLHRFVQELLQYLSVMLSLRPAEIQAPHESQKSSQSTVSIQSSSDAPLIVVFDIEMNAPIISMPRSSDSMDSVEADLGMLQLHNKVVYDNGLLIEQAMVTFTGVGCTFAKEGVRGENVIHNDAQGWQLHWHRPLRQTNALPSFDLKVKIPVIAASITDKEYMLVTSVAAANIAEPLRVPKSAEWIAEHALAEFQEVGREEGLARRRSSSTEQPGTQKASPGIQVSLDLDSAELNLSRHMEGVAGTTAQPLSQFLIADLHVAFSSDSTGSMKVAACLPRVEAKDLRRNTPQHQQMVISSANKASFLILEWEASPGMVNHSLAIILQKPTFKAELSFLFALTKYFLPDLALGASTLPYYSLDVLLAEKTYVAERDVFLSPACRLLADNLCGDIFKYDGGGHRLVLPSRNSLGEVLPLIIIGAHKTLHLSNVQVVNTASLSACLQLGPGAQLITDVGVEMVETAAVHEIMPMSPGPSGTLSLAPQSPTRTQPEQIPAYNQKKSTFKISFVSTGMGLQFMQYDEQQRTQQLVAKLDVQGSYEVLDQGQKGSLELNGIRVDTRTIDSLEGAASLKKLKGSKKNMVLSPCKLGLSFDLNKNTNMELDLTSVKLVLTPDVVALVTEMVHSAVGPLLQPPVQKPLAPCNTFERVWCSDTCGDEHTLGALDWNLSAWRPQPPAGYASLGDILVTNTCQPAFEVLTVAMNSGVAVFPNSFERVNTFETAGLSVWRPMPPPGYIALGDIVSISATKAPPIESIACIHQGCLVDSAAGEYIAVSVSDDTVLWMSDSSVATFYATANKVVPPNYFDFRSPLGVSPAALSAMGAVGADNVTKMSPKRLYQNFQEQKKKQTSTPSGYSTLGLTASIVDFRRIWTDFGKETNGEGITIWRPVTPLGYQSLGDCLVCGLEPPPSALIVKEIDQAGHSTLAAPRTYDLVYQDSTASDDLRLLIWKPVAPPGYVSLGYVASVGQQPSKNAARCLRSDLASPVTLHGHPLKIIKRSPKGMYPLSTWVIDDRFKTFFALASDTIAYLPKGSECYTLRSDADLQHDDAAPQATETSGSVNIVVRTGPSFLMVCNTARVPVLHMDLGAIEAGVHGPSKDVIQAYVGLRLGMWSYNPGSRHWEPVIEPWDVIARCDANYSMESDGGIEPGIHASIKASNECVYTTMAANAITNILHAIEEWTFLEHPSGKKGGAMLNGDGSSIPVKVVNLLGVDAAMELDYGGRLELVSVPASNEPVMIMKPTARHPFLHGVEQLPSTEALPLVLVLLDIQSINVSSGGTYFCAAEILHKNGLRVRTRAVSVATEGHVVFAERLILPLTVEESKQQLLLSLQVFASAFSDVPVACMQLSLDYEGTINKMLHHFKVEDEGIQLEGEYAVQRQYQNQLRWSKEGEESTAGQRAVSLPTSKGLWTVLPTADVTSGISILRIGHQTLVVEEETLPDGSRKEVLRSLCQVVNTTRLSLEASLVLVSEESDWEVVQGANVVEDEVLENERWYAHKGWSSTNLRPSDPAHYSTSTGDYDHFPDLDAPIGWEWEGGWELDRSRGGDRAGWRYGIDWEHLMSSDSTQNDSVRRRRWVRKRTACKGGRDKSSTHLPPQVPTVMQRTVVGIIKPGESLPLPLIWQERNLQLQVRPLVESARTHDWSLGANGLHTVRLEALDESVTQLLMCIPLQSIASAGSVLAASTLWFSLTVESELHRNAGDAQASVDWKVIIAPPVVIKNDLPLSGSLLVWEQKDMGSLVDRQAADLGKGESLELYTADVRQPLSFTFYVEGYEWSEPSPVGLSRGSSYGSNKMLPDRFRLTKHGSTLQTEIYMLKDISFGGWLSDATDDIEPGVILAQGVPMRVRLIAPLWVVNASLVPVDLAIVSVPMVRGAVKETFAQREQQQQELKVVRTFGLEEFEQLRGRRIASQSLELVSVPLSQLFSSAAAPSQQKVQYGAQIRIGKSGWTPPLILDATGGNGDASSTAQAATEPLLIRAMSGSVVHELIARLSWQENGVSAILRLEPHVLVSNRTTVGMQLLLCKPVIDGLSQSEPSVSKRSFSRRRLEGGEVSSGVLLPEGSSTSYRQVQDYLPMGNYGTFDNSRETPVSRMTSFIKATPDRCVGQVIELAADVQPVQLDLMAGLGMHTLCFRAKDAPNAIWSRPVTLSHLDGEEMHVLIPCSEDTDNQGLKSKILRIAVERRAVGVLHVILQSVHSEPPYVLENRTSTALVYRQAHVDGIPFHTLPPWSAVGWVWEYSTQGLPIEIEMGGTPERTENYVLDAPVFMEASARARATPKELVLGESSPHYDRCTVKIGYWEQVMTSPQGLERIGEDFLIGTIGRGGTDRVLCIAPGREPLFGSGSGATYSKAQFMEVVFELNTLEISLVDRHPEELLTVTLTGLKLAANSGVNPSGAYSSARCSLCRIQVDDQLPGTRFPVLLSSCDASSKLPLLSAATVRQVGAHRGSAFYPTMIVQWPHTVQLAVNEPLVWKTLDMVQRIQDQMQKDASNQASMDVPLRIRLLSVGKLRSKISFQGDPLSRPRNVQGGVISLIMDLANFHAAPVAIKGLDVSDVSMLRSAFYDYVLSVLRGQAFSVAISLVRNFGLVGGASRVLGALSAGIAKFAKGSRKVSTAQYV